MIEMKLHPEPFEKMKSGEKTEEYRIYDAKRRALEVGDFIRFRKRPDLEDVLLMEITSISIYPGFEKMYEESEWKSEGTQEEFLKGMREFYSEQEEKENGAITISMRMVSKEE
jgi:ASC-1-like (ASCH) protein